MNEPRQSSDDPRDFERELASLSPRPASPRLRERIEARLAPPATNWRLRLALAAASVVIAAGLLLLARPAPTPPSIAPPPADPSLATTIDIPPIDPNLPSVLVYQRAYAQSELLLDFLLDAHAATAHADPRSAAPPAPQPQRLFNPSTMTRTPAEDPL